MSSDAADAGQWRISDAIARLHAYLDRLPDDADLPAALLEAAQLMIRHGEYGEATRLTERSNELALRRGDEAGALVAEGTLGQLLRRGGDLRRALLVARTGFDRATRLGLDHERSTFMIDVSLALHLLGDLPGSLDAARSAERIADEGGDPSGGLHAAGRIGVALRAMGRIDDAHRTTLDGIRRARELGDHREEFAFQTDLAQCLLLLDRPAEALEAYRAAVVLAFDHNERDSAVRVAETIGDEPLSQAQPPILWLGTVAAASVAMQGGELRSRAAQAAVRAAAVATATDSPTGVASGLVNLRKIVPRVGDGSPRSLLDLALEAIMSWYMGADLRGIRDSIADLDRDLGTEPLLTDLLTGPRPAGAETFDGTPHDPTDAVRDTGSE
ncbi:hypothetical protein EV383_2698 [Pseudonocardia sediminis]|uniref:Tetratricopeptide repeat protein n=1 Tax=Pseudonocardia sediminis TaxID=1397368 RepID=A0A4Q7UV26_PSEST|nr:tetratricopeptide repeat protein [Pseudonocardia sediminis]RZT85817.1 hypothetical protein EV383_2698 [Pseudonocardia sediminis]